MSIVQAPLMASTSAAIRTSSRDPAGVRREARRLQRRADIAARVAWGPLLDSADREAVVRMAEDGVSRPEAAELTGLSPAFLLLLTTQARTQWAVGMWRQEDDDRLTDLVGRGLSRITVATAMRLGKSRVETRAATLGLEWRSDYRRFDAAEDQLLREFQAQGLPAREIARRLGRSTTGVLHRARALGIQAFRGRARAVRASAVDCHVERLAALGVCPVEPVKRRLAADALPPQKMTSYAVSPVSASRSRMPLERWGATTNAFESGRRDSVSNGVHCRSGTKPRTSRCATWLRQEPPPRASLEHFAGRSRL